MTPAESQCDFLRLLHQAADSLADLPAPSGPLLGHSLVQVGSSLWEYQPSQVSPLRPAILQQGHTPLLHSVV
jgi:hypothetical protein